MGAAPTVLHFVGNTCAQTLTPEGWAKLTDIPLPALGSGIIFITGPSGSGKSTILHQLKASLQGAFDCAIVSMTSSNMACDDEPSHDRALVDCFPYDMPLSVVLAALSRAGLAEAPTLLRSPKELSEGQRARLALARAMIEAEQLAAMGRHVVLVADEFAATLDRLTARSIARQLRAWLTQKQQGPKNSPSLLLIAATTHDDLLESLEPDVLVYKPLGPTIALATAPGEGGRQ